MVLDHFIFHNTHSGFGYSQLCQRDTFLVGSHSGGEKDLIYLLLGIGCKYFLGFFHRSDLCL